MKKEFAKWIYWHAQHCQPAEFEPWLERVKKTCELYRMAGLTDENGVFKAGWNIAIEIDVDSGSGCGSCIYHLGGDEDLPCPICTRLSILDPELEIFHADHHRKIEE